MTEKTYAEQLKAARKKAGLTQAGLADWTGIPRRTLEDWETGRMTPPPWAQGLVLEKIGTRYEKEELQD